MIILSIYIIMIMLSVDLPILNCLTIFGFLHFYQLDKQAIFLHLKNFNFGSEIKSKSVKRLILEIVEHSLP